jgi:cystathionine gamma-synthase
MHEVAKKQMPGGYGGVLSFEIVGGLEAVARVLPRLKYAYMAANLGQVDTVVGPPALTSHVECTEEERRAAGIPEGLIRYAVGIEDSEDLIADMDQALSIL